VPTDDRTRRGTLVTKRAVATGASSTTEPCVCVCVCVCVCARIAFCVCQDLEGYAGHKISNSWSKRATAPPKNKYCTVLHCNPPPLAGTSRQVQRVQTGPGLGLGMGVQGQGQAELGLGGQGVLGRLADHSSLTLLENFNFCYRPTTGPFRNKYIYIYI